MRTWNRSSRRGFVLILMGVMAVALFGAVGLAVDIGRMYIVKTEIQSFSDAAALAAALKLNGTASGFTAAKTAVAGIDGTWNIGSQKITGYTVEFATTKAGAWSASPVTGTDYLYARVTASGTLPLYFLPVVTGKTSETVSSRAIAGQIAITSFTVGLEPYTVVVQKHYEDGIESATPDEFGLVAGAEYDIQWPQFNNTRNGCSDDNPEKCFNSPTCAGDSLYARKSVKNYWGSNYNGYWGSSSNSVIYQQVMSGLQLQPVTIGGYLTMSSGNKNAQALALDDRTNQDQVNTVTTLAAYLGNATHNGRRLLTIPVVRPKENGTQVYGYASMYLVSDGSPSRNYARGTGNDPFCAQYVGPGVIGSPDPGASAGGGAFKVALVQ